MQIIPRDKVVLFHSGKNPAAYSVEDGEKFWVEMKDCYLGQITDESILRTDIDLSVMDSAVGPIEVRGAMPGDVLTVEIGDFELADRGIMVTSKGLGILGDRITEGTTRFLPIREGYAYLREDLRFPLSPMIGGIGVAPGVGEVHCSIPHDHGGNMDTKLVTRGSKIYFPVRTEGAGLSLGDMHASMGDGEMDGTGLEVSGRVCLRVSLRKDLKICRPVIETTDSIYFLASRETLEESLKLGAGDAADFLMERFDLDFHDAYRLLSAVCDAQISELVDDNVTVRIRVPKFDRRLKEL